MKRSALLSTIALVLALGSATAPAFAMAERPYREGRGDGHGGGGDHGCRNCSSGGDHKPTVVPEIDAGTGAASAAIVLAALALAWERRRRPS